MTTGKIIIGSIAILIGISLLFIPHLIGTIYALVFIAIGILIIIFHKSDNQIEQRKDMKGGKK